MQYLTPEHYEIALANGISKKHAYNRFYYKHWSLERAITEPLNIKPIKYPISEELAEKLKENSISHELYRCRLRQGWDSEKASTTPPLRDRKKQKYPLKQELADGVSYRRYRERIDAGWSMKEARTKPIMSKSECAAMGAAGREKKKRKMKKLEKQIDKIGG